MPTGRETSWSMAFPTRLQHSGLAVSVDPDFPFSISEAGQTARRQKTSVHRSRPDQPFNWVLSAQDLQTFAAYFGPCTVDPYTANGPGPLSSHRWQSVLGVGGDTFKGCLHLVSDRSYAD